MGNKIFRDELLGRQVKVDFRRPSGCIKQKMALDLRKYHRLYSKTGLRFFENVLKRGEAIEKS